jgi:hypothetical protein
MHDIEWLQKGTHEKHLSVLEFEKRERAKEVKALTEEKEILLAENQQLGMEQEELLQENKSLETENEELQSENQLLESEQKELQKSLEQMVESKIVLERNIHAYDEDKKWQLPEATMLMGAKTYRDTYAMPLVIKLKKIVKNLTVKCVQLMERNKELGSLVKHLEEQVSSLWKQVGEERTKVVEMQRGIKEYQTIKEYIGEKRIGEILDIRKEEKKRTDKKGTKKRQTANAPRAVFRALMRAHPHIEICLYSLPLSTATSPDKAALLIGAYYALISAASLPFGRLTADPLLDAKTKPAAPLDCRIKIRTCDFLYTFLVFLVQYRKEKEAKTHG